MNPTKPRFKILFLCTGNSARSIMAEYLLKRKSPERFEVYSAGANPRSSPHPMALKVLQETFQIDTTGARSKSWNEYSGTEFDFVITLCDNAKESCPVWTGLPIISHWNSPDPTDFKGDEKSTRHIFWQVSQQISRRLELLAGLPFEKLDALRIEAATKEIGNMEMLNI